MTTGDLFSGERTTFETTEGPIDMPLRFYNSAAAISTFQCDHDKVADYIAHTGLTAVKLPNDKALVAMAFYKHRDQGTEGTNIEPYTELICGIMASAPVVKTPQAASKGAGSMPGLFIFHLPVTSPLACAAGLDIWSYPKFVTDIDFEFGGGSFTGTVFDPATKEEIISISGPFGKGGSVPMTSGTTYTMHDGSILKTGMQSSGTGKSTSAKDVKLTVGPSDHPMTKDFRAMRLDKALPFQLQTYDKIEFAVGFGEKISPE